MFSSYIDIKNYATIHNTFKMVLYLFILTSTIFDKPLIVVVDFYSNIFFLFFISQILVRHRVSYVYSYCSNPPANTLDCISGCTGSMVMIANCTESNSAENWADFEGETIFDIKNSTSSPINFRSVL